MSLYKAQIIDLGRSHVNKDFFYNKLPELRREIQSHLMSKGWDLHQVDNTDTYKVVAGFREVGTVIVTEVKSI